MAAADYYLCDICHRKTIYDSDVDWRAAGDMAVICQDCAKTHKVVVMKRDDLAALGADPTNS